ncbi:profilin-like [Hydractinia symbiolongicarpus]|uniref:profilin-like n=1 Tax=Hydractinia symbiolongicarpus TaxID=13093 RepID=UPI0025505345|nr:profilin-like [Hydractinia symbiolongicarpus]
MSWDGYIDNIIGRAKNSSCDKACIIGLDGGGPWTTAANANNITLAAGEGQKIAAALKSQQFDAFQANGIWVAGLKYQFLRSVDDNCVLGKKKDNGAITIMKSKTAVVIAHTKEGGQHGDTNAAVESIVQYLESSNM